MLICGAATDSGRSLLRCTDIQQHNGHNRTLNCTLCKINMVLAALTPGRLGGQRNESGGGGFQERSRRRCFLPLTGSRRYFHGCPLLSRVTEWLWGGGGLDS